MTEEKKPSDLQEVLDRFPTRVALSYARFVPGSENPEDFLPPKEVVVVLEFSETGFGFGEVCIHQTSEGVFLDTEHMSLERVKGYFSALLDKAILDTDKDPEKHALYNRVMGRRCGERCRACFPVEVEEK